MFNDRRLVRLAMEITEMIGSGELVFKKKAAGEDLMQQLGLGSPDQMKPEGTENEESVGEQKVQKDEKLQKDVGETEEESKGLDLPPMSGPESEGETEKQESGKAKEPKKTIDVLLEMKKSLNDIAGLIKNMAEDKSDENEREF